MLASTSSRSTTLSKQPARPRHSITGTMSIHRLTSMYRFIHRGRLARSMPCWLLLLVSEHSQRPLAENSVGAGKSYDQRERHCEEEADAQHLWVYAPGEIEHIPNQCPCQD